MTRLRKELLGRKFVGLADRRESSVVFLDLSPDETELFVNRKLSDSFPRVRNLDATTKFGS